MLIIIGKTAAGKNTVVKKLIDKGYKPLITYTTRPKRENENGDEYHFISEEDFNEKVLSGFFAEWSSYDTVDGKWYYGSAKEDYINANEKTVVILNPDGLKSASDYSDLPVKSVYLYADNATIRKRLAIRGTKKDEAERRIKADNYDFRFIDQYTDRIIYNNYDADIEEVVEKILKVAEG